MLHRTLGSLILVAGVSYMLARACWQVVLLTFLAAGLSCAIWRIRKAILRRTKIKSLWRRASALDASGHTASAKTPIQQARYSYSYEEVEYSTPQAMATAERVTREMTIPASVPTSVPASIQATLPSAASKTVELPVFSETSAQLASRSAGQVGSTGNSRRTKEYRKRLVALNSQTGELPVYSAAESRMVTAPGKRTSLDGLDSSQLSQGGRVYKLKLSDFSEISQLQGFSRAGSGEESGSLALI
jgi:hypothetical protein